VPAEIRVELIEEFGYRTGPAEMRVELAVELLG
jgi:hypothetical protein